jgi:hypothetical protein
VILNGALIEFGVSFIEFHFLGVRSIECLDGSKGVQPLFNETNERTSGAASVFIGFLLQLGEQEHDDCPNQKDYNERNG